MKSNVTEIAPDVYRISTFHPDYQIQFNQFLVKDDEPFLMHTGFRKMFDLTHEAVASLIDPATLRWIGFSHFEPDVTDRTMSRLAALEPRTLALMHGSSFCGDGRAALLELAGVIKEVHGSE